MALDCALSDLATQTQGVPLYRYRGERASDERTDMTLSADERVILVDSPGTGILGLI
jgi:L-alanine-DL-glutamate epimerase-like enolase superfamily enzyme